MNNYEVTVTISSTFNYVTIVSAVNEEVAKSMAIMEAEYEFNIEIVDWNKTSLTVKKI